MGICYVCPPKMNNPFWGGDFCRETYTVSFNWHYYLYSNSSDAKKLDYMLINIEHALVDIMCSEKK